MSRVSLDRTIFNCAGESHEVEFDFVCPQTWQNLSPTDNPKRRHCTQCDKDVYWCHDAIEAGIRAEQGECIALPTALVSLLHEQQNQVTIGRARSSQSMFEQAYLDLQKARQNEEPQ